MGKFINWHAGMEVVCIGANLLVCADDLTIGKVYKLTSIGVDEFTEEVVVTLEGMRHCNCRGGYEARFFKPLEKRETDISVFRNLLKPIKRKQPEDA